MPARTTQTRASLDFSRVQHTTIGISAIVINAGIIAILRSKVKLIGNIGIRAVG